MICVPTELLKQYTQLLGKRNTPRDLYFNYQKWLRYYVYFCHKYQFIPSDKNSLPYFHWLSRRVVMRYAAVFGALVIFAAGCSQANTTSVEGQSETPSKKVLIVTGIDYPGVFHSVLGHDVQALDNPDVGRLYRNACAWGAGLEALDN